MRKIQSLKWLPIICLVACSSGGTVQDESAEPGNSETNVQSSTSPSEEQLAKTAIDSNKTQDVFDLCVEQRNRSACNYFQDSCSHKDANGCAWLASVYKRNPMNEAESDAKYKASLVLACKYGNTYACRTMEEDLSADIEQTKADIIYSKVKCAMTEQQVIRALGSPEATSDCVDNLYRSYKYGDRWIIFKDRGAFAIIDHLNYQGPCLENVSYFGKKGNVLCDGK